jgi:hypothetical protein
MYSSSELVEEEASPVCWLETKSKRHWQSAFSGRLSARALLREQLKNGSLYGSLCQPIFVHYILTGTAMSAILPKHGI